ncbi:CRISPR-associated endoribonuclease Cas6, partial [Slackia sp. CM382]|uniref:CRISPR-associated endoribonuclease Cas6 n=1 Tax=Slackia sp. CM382 TaxID=1111137 RepID=UPI00058782AE
MQHLSTLELRFSLSEDIAMSRGQVASMGPFLQGFLMECIASDYATYLHGLPFNPYSQYCFLGDNGKTLKWRISTLTNEAFEQIAAPIQLVDSIEIKSLHLSLPVEQRTLETISLKDLTDSIYADESSKQSITFITPASFKQSGSYMFMPSVRLIFQNLLMRYGQVYENEKEIDPGTLEFIEQNVRMASYDLRSQYFSHAMNESRKVPAFVGSLRLSIRGSQALTGLVHMLSKFGEYSGIGIKTSMGMGGMRCR